MNKEKELAILADRVKALRLDKGLTQSDCFNDTGIHFGRIEQGKRDPSYTTLLRIATYFEIEVKELVS